MVHRGLRIVLKPAIENMSFSSIAMWNEVLSNASFSLVRIIIRHYKSLLTSIRNQENQLISCHKITDYESVQLAEFERKK